jgi:uncharacterized protein
MPMIRETIVTTVDRGGRTHVAPLGLIQDGEHWIIAPFRPSTTLDNLREVPHAVASHVDDVRIFAGCLTGRRAWPLVATGGPVPRLAAAHSHWELSADGVTEDDERPRFRMRLAAVVSHAPASGFNRAQGAVIELAILSSRLDMLPRDKVRREIEYLAIAVEKTAGEDEREAWAWLMEKVRAFYGGDP